MLELLLWLLFVVFTCHLNIFDCRPNVHNFMAEISQKLSFIYLIATSCYHNFFHPDVLFSKWLVSGLTLFFYCSLAAWISQLAIILLTDNTNTLLNKHLNTGLFYCTVFWYFFLQYNSVPSPVVSNAVTFLNNYYIVVWQWYIFLSRYRVMYSSCRCGWRWQAGCYIQCCTTLKHQHWWFVSWQCQSAIIWWIVSPARSTCFLYVCADDLSVILILSLTFSMSEVWVMDVDAKYSWIRS